jgi:hypothetical protein
MYINRFEALLTALYKEIPSQTHWINLGYEVDAYLSRNRRKWNRTCCF